MITRKTVGGITIALLMLAGCMQKTQPQDPETIAENAIMTTAEHKRMPEGNKSVVVPTIKKTWRKKGSVHTHQANKPHVETQTIIKQPENTLTVIVKDGGKVGEEAGTTKHDAPTPEPVVSTPAPVITTPVAPIPPAPVAPVAPVVTPAVTPEPATPAPVAPAPAQPADPVPVAPAAPAAPAV